jgi:DNA-binding CsgD family transcriptional regulator
MSPDFQDESADDATTNESKKPTRLLRNLVGFSFNLSPLLLIYMIIQDEQRGSDFSYPLFASFFIAFIVTILVIMVIDTSPLRLFNAMRKQRTDLVSCTLLSIGCLLGLIVGENGSSLIAIHALSFAFIGTGSALSFLLWEHTLVVYSGWRLLLVVLCWIAVLGVFCWFCAIANLSTIVVLTIVAAIASSWLRLPSERLELDPAVRPSMLADITARRYLVRHTLAFALLGAVTTMMIKLCLVIPQSIDSVVDNSFFMLGAPVITLLVFIAFSITRGFDYLFSLSLLIIPGLVCFFPIAPGTTLSWSILVHENKVWIMVLLGIGFLAISETNRVFLRIGKYAYGTGLLGMSTGAVLISALLLGDWWNVVLNPETLSGTTNACVVGLLSIFCVYMASNLWVNNRSLRYVILIARGTVPSTLSYADTNHVRDTEDAETTDRLVALNRACYEIAFEKSLSPRELEVFTILARGNSLKKVQDELVIAEGTAITHRRNIYRKLNVHSKQEMLDYVDRSLSL